MENERIQLFDEETQDNSIIPSKIVSYEILLSKDAAAIRYPQNAGNKNALIQQGFVTSVLHYSDGTSVSCDYTTLGNLFTNYSREEKNAIASKSSIAIFGEPKAKLLYARDKQLKKEGKYLISVLGQTVVAGAVLPAKFKTVKNNPYKRTKGPILLPTWLRNTLAVTTLGAVVAGTVYGGNYIYDRMNNQNPSQSYQKISSSKPINVGTSKDDTLSPQEKLYLDNKSAFLVKSDVMLDKATEKEIPGNITNLSTDELKEIFNISGKEYTAARIKFVSFTDDYLKKMDHGVLDDFYDSLNSFRTKALIMSTIATEEDINIYDSFFATDEDKALAQQFMSNIVNGCTKEEAWNNILGMSKSSNPGMNVFASNIAVPSYSIHKMLDNEYMATQGYTGNTDSTDKSLINLTVEWDKSFCETILSSKEVLAMLSATIDEENAFYKANKKLDEDHNHKSLTTTDLKNTAYQYLGWASSNKENVTLPPRKRSSENFGGGRTLAVNQQIFSSAAEGDAHYDNVSSGNLDQAIKDAYEKFPDLEPGSVGNTDPNQPPTEELIGTGTGNIVITEPKNPSDGGYHYDDALTGEGKNENADDKASSIPDNKDLADKSQNAGDERDYSQEESKDQDTNDGSNDQDTGDDSKDPDQDVEVNPPTSGGIIGVVPGDPVVNNTNTTDNTAQGQSETAEANSTTAATEQKAEAPATAQVATDISLTSDEVNYITGNITADYDTSTPPEAVAVTATTPVAEPVQEAQATEPVAAQVEALADVSTEEVAVQLTK